MADMSMRRASSGSHTESKKRKYSETVEEGESDDGETSDFPCPHCRAIFVTEISLNRHVITYHDREALTGEGFLGEPETDMDGNVKESENGYLDNEEGDYYGDHDGDNDVDLAIAEYLEDSNDPEEKTVMDGTADSAARSHNHNLRTSPTQKSSKPQLSQKDLQSVLSQVDEITSVSTSDFVTCPICRKTFGRKELPIHVSCEHGGAKFTCPYCGRNISRRDHLKRHIKNVHPDMCTETEIGPFPRNLNLSRATTNGTQKAPGQAGGTTSPQHSMPQSMESPSLLKALPISIVTPRVTLLEEDDDEEDDFEGEDDLLQGNGMDEDDTQELLQEDTMQITVEPDLPFQDFGDFNEEEYHTPSFLLDSLDQFQQKMPPAVAANIQISSVNNMAYQCSLCNAVFSSKVLLDRHESTHSELRPHKCSVCGKGFLRKEHLSKHLSSVHSGMKFTCEFCGKDISRKDHLIRHIRNVHPNQFFAMPREAQAEQDLYLQTPLLQPQQLPVQVQAAALKATQSLQPKPKKSFFNCDMCEATFINVDDLYAHQSTIHADVRKYKCNYCCKAFKRKEHLTKHEVLHTGEKKFTCRICGHEFQRKEVLQDHIRRIHGIDPTGLNGASNGSSNSNATVISTIPCNLCDQLFQDRGSLLSHMTSVHGLIVNSPPGLPKNLQRNSSNPPAQQKPPQPKPVSSAKNGVGGKTVPTLNGSNLGSLMDLINKGSITLSYHPIKSDS